MQAVNDALKMISQSLKMLDDLKMDINLVSLDEEMEITAINRVSALLSQAVDRLAG